MPAVVLRIAEGRSHEAAGPLAPRRDSEDDKFCSRDPQPTKAAATSAAANVPSLMALIASLHRSGR
jgi:hypothetical protein